ncbi:MAG: methylated-DNA--[protein]-cysteine S-methyltransferase [Desulfarculaceae bacterium]|nr:methylated-DNA--[protein]-cysteine S-methyltransferase [Desulfarculaceae bacterium]MCF8071872.1 methylated-DNA--[protein]-cysteine S-methyltransferase [Desulfarculaceae bacterium]MCF8101422.1 methylated-DNA--[protein]-cysteine S-methyltransferase [Desulfarculaceae bacterium]MCF8117413.1 methylated-DNA--[protein]-cysteine S-methyltransferase [Desulfarculaceae bacterium]
MLNRDYQRIEQAIAYLEENAPDQPSLAQVAGAVGLSRFHFQRLFQRYAGVSPKRFLQFITASEARRLLDESRPVLDAAFDLGLSSPSRLHDLTLAVYALTPGELARRGQGLEIRHGYHDTPFGRCLLGVTDRGVCWLSFLNSGEEDAALEDLSRDWPKAALRWDQRVTSPVARRIFQPMQETASRPLPLLLKGSNFQIQVWQALLRVPPGSCIAYGELARRLGRPGAARAVGSAAGANPIAYLIPCHRVLRATGALGGYRWGLGRKRVMLAREAAQAAG